MKLKRQLKMVSDGQKYRNKLHALLLCILIITCTIAHYPQSNFLRQNYPNPFYSETTIEYFFWNNEEMELHKSSLSETSMIVYNILGSEVWRIPKGDMVPTGGQAVRIDTKDFPSGIYFCKLQWGDYFETIKMIKLQ